jgi:hypothetical protein
VMVRDSNVQRQVASSRAGRSLLSEAYRLGITVKGGLAWLVRWLKKHVP